MGTNAHDTHAKVMKLHMIPNSPGMLPAVLGYRMTWEATRLLPRHQTEQFQNRLGEREEAEHLDCVKGDRVFMIQAITGFFHLTSLA